MDHILVELHGVDFNNIKAILLATNDAHTRLSHKKRNRWVCGGYQ